MHPPVCLLQEVFTVTPFTNYPHSQYFYFTVTKLTNQFYPRTSDSHPMVISSSSSSSHPLLKHNWLILTLLNHIFCITLQELWILALVDCPQRASWCPSAGIHYWTICNTTRQIITRDLARRLGLLVHVRLTHHDHGQEDTNTVTSVGGLKENCYH